MNEKKQRLHQRSYFDKEFSQVEGYRLSKWQESYTNRIKEHVLDKNYKNKTLIDVATGTGYVAIEMAKLGLNVIACDLSPEAIRNLKKYKKQFVLKNLQLLECLAENIPLSNKSVDYIVANAILEHIPDEKKAINEWKRILKKGGKLFVTVPLKFRYIWPFLWLPNYIHDKKIGHLRRYDKKSLEKAFGLPARKVFYSGHLIKVLGIVLSLLTKGNSLADYFEKEDRKKEKRVYGANNMSVIFTK